MRQKLCDEPRPDWTDSVLQGLAYWIGYKKQYYRFYPLSEGAIVGETLSLLASQIENNTMRLNAEVMYKNICKWEGNGRADIVISARPNRNDRKNNIDGKNKDFNYKKYARTIIEVKRHGSDPKLIEKDLERLAKCLHENPKVRCFLLLVSQDGIPQKPNKYVTSNGHASGSDYSIKDRPNYYTRVRRVCKAISKFDKMDKEKNIIKAAKDAYYACLIEVIQICEDTK